MAEDLQTLLDDLMTAAVEVAGTPVSGSEPAAAFLSHADAVSALETARRRLMELLDTFPKGHVANFRATDWVLEHPLSCRRADRSLSECPLNQKPLVCAPTAMGRYEVDLRDGELAVGAPVSLYGHVPVAATLDSTVRNEEVDNGGNGQQDGSQQDGGQQDGQARHGRRAGTEDGGQWE